MVSLNVNGIRAQASPYGRFEAAAAKTYKSPFLDDLTQADTAQTKPATETEEAADTANMDLDEYRNHIRSLISQFSREPSHGSCTHAVNIPDEGLKAMKSDPAYEKLVLDNIEKRLANLAPQNETGGCDDSIYYYGATKEKWYALSWHTEDNNSAKEETGGETSEDNIPVQRELGGETAKESDWEKRVRLHRENMELAQSEWDKEQLIKALKTRRVYVDADGNEYEYSSGVPASALLSGLA